MPRSPRAIRPAHPMHHLAAAAALATLPLGAAAQASTPGKLETVTVTAEKRAENIKDVPNSVSTLSGEFLDALNSGGEDIRLLSGRVPSLNIESSFGRAFPRFYIRGIGNTDFDLNASQPVSLVFDEVVQENPILKGFPLFDLERIEVLRGPQGTLFGRNAPGGVVKFESAKPGKTAGGYGSIGVGQDTMVNLEGAVNVPVSKDLALRLSMQSQSRDDWLTNTHAPGPTKALEGYDDSAFRLQALYQSNPAFSALFNLHGRDLKGSARAFRANIIKPGTNDLVDGFDEKKISLDGVNQQDVGSFGGSLRLRWDLGNGMALNSITAMEKVKSYSRGDIDGGFGAPYAPPFGPGFIPFDAESADGLPYHRQLTQELRLESTAATGLKWLAGLYYFDEAIEIDSFNYSSPFGNVQNGYAYQRQENNAWAAFGSLNVPVTPAFEVRAGLRYTKDEKDFVAQRLQSPIGGGATGVLTLNPSDTNTSGDLAASYKVSPAMNVYARLASGFRAPSIQGRLLFGNTPTTADTETVTSIEAGMKADLLDGRARVALNVFHYQIKDQQLTAVGGNANFNQLVNAAKSVGSGLELDLQALPTDRLLLGLGLGLNKTRIKDPDLRVDACGNGCTVLDPVTAPANPAIGKFAPTVSIDGNSLPQAPKVTLNFTARYAIPTASGAEWYVLGDVAYRSKVNFFLYESKEYTGKALTTVGLRGGYLWGNGKYEASAFVRNLANEIQAVGGIDFNNLTGFINEPRVVGVQFRANF
jgi:iron complex outermembrane recepter protein